MGIVCLCYKLYKTPGCISQPWKINKNWQKKSLTLCVWFNASHSNCFDAGQKIRRMPVLLLLELPWKADWVVNAELSSTEYLCSGLPLQMGNGVVAALKVCLTKAVTHVISSLPLFVFSVPVSISNQHKVGQCTDTLPTSCVWFDLFGPNMKGNVWHSTILHNNCS